MTPLLSIRPRQKKKKLSFFGGAFAFSLKTTLSSLDRGRLFTPEDLNHSSHTPDLRRFQKLSLKAKETPSLMPNG
ncbi:unnamed protein product [Arabis nemorensis]|uniref:Uncharacterized protein n=1 Tax=Arabis nemorensis TaxID=586526 RepID=A0A565B9W7_9BRAS|nr:unnamed protein product [Arabis nemorensis]